jgi:hypothetical protein
MEKHVYITGTSKELEFWSLYSKVSTPKMWGAENRVKDNVYKYEVTVRIPDESQIQDGRTYSFYNFLKRTDDLALVKFISDFNNLLSNYRCS